jgi:hypothetical protein
MTNRKITQYPPTILKSYASKSKEHFVKQAILNKNYDDLAYLIKVFNQDWQESEKKIVKLEASLKNATAQHEKDQYVAKFTNNTVAAANNQSELGKLFDALSSNLQAVNNSLSSLNQSTKISSEIISLIQKKNYLQFDANDINIYALDTAFDTFDVKAVKIIIEQSGKAIYSNSYSLSRLFAELFDNELHNLVAIENIAQKKTQILKIMLDDMPKSSVNAEILTMLSHVLPKQEFENFYKSKAIDLKDAAYKDLDLKHFQLEEQGPLGKIGAKNLNVTDMILTKTYSEDLSLEQISSIYQKLYNLHPIAKEMLGYMAHLIKEHNDVKIIFGKDLVSSYAKMPNIIRVDSNFINETIMNIESVTIHEIGHFVYSQLFGADHTPFNLSPIKNILNKLFNIYLEFEKNPYHNLYNQVSAAKETIDELLSGPKEFSEMVSVYKKAALQPLYKAAELLKLNISELAQYNDTIASTRYFKDHSNIDVFLLNSALSLNLREDLNTTSTSTIRVFDSIFDNLLQTYLEEEISCHSPYSHSHYLSRDEITIWNIEQFFPALVRDLELSPKQIHFLERIADYVNRDEQILDNGMNQFNCKSSGLHINEQYAELIVRSMELKAAGIDEAASFQELDNFHMQYVSPSIKQEIYQSYQEKFAFLGELMQSNGLAMPDMCLIDAIS